MYTHSEDLAGYAANQTYRKANQRSEKYHTRGRARVVLVLICYCVPSANMRETLGGGGGGSHPLEAYSIGPDSSEVGEDISEARHEWHNWIMCISPLFRAATANFRSRKRRGGEIFCIHHCQGKTVEMSADRNSTLLENTLLKVISRSGH